jgi:predicted flap endonuclease-1-like 5' DNA nuclease
MFDLSNLHIASILLGMGLGLILGAIFDRSQKKGVQIYETSAEDGILINKLKADLSAANENADKVAEVHAYARQLESKVQLLESAQGAPGSPDSELRVKVLEQQLAEKADLEGRLAVALQQLNDFKAKADMFDSVVAGKPAVMPTSEPAPFVAPVVEPTAKISHPEVEKVAEPEAKIEVEVIPPIEVIENNSAPSAEPVHTNGSSAHQPEPQPALRVETSEPAPAVAYSGSKDPLEKIDGIGQVYQQKLYEANIFTFAQLAAASPSRITEIIEPQNWQHIDVMKWRRDAALFAAGEKS